MGEIADTMNLMVDYLYDTAYAFGVGIQEEVDKAATEGQESLLQYYIFPAVSEVVEEWEEDWPKVNADDYATAAYNSHESVADCWSIIIDEYTEQLEQIVDEAQRLEESAKETAAAEAAAAAAELASEIEFDDRDDSPDRRNRGGGDSKGSLGGRGRKGIPGIKWL